MDIFVSIILDPFRILDEMCFNLTTFYRRLLCTRRQLHRRPCYNKRLQEFEVDFEVGVNWETTPHQPWETGSLPLSADKSPRNPFFLRFYLFIFRERGREGEREEEKHQLERETLICCLLSTRD